MRRISEAPSAGARASTQALWRTGLRWLFLLLLGFGSGTGWAEDWELSYTAGGMELDSAGYTPLYLDIKNPRKQRLDIDLTGSNYSNVRYRFVRQINLGDNTDLRLEIPVPSGVSNYNIKLTQQQGRSLESYFHPKSGSRYGSSTTNNNIFTLNGKLHGVISDHLAKNRRGPQPTEAVTLHPYKLPVLWQSYAGLRGVIMIEPNDLTKFTDRQREAISQWVRWGNGRIWLIGADPMADARGLGLNLGQASTRLSGGITVYECMTGQVWTKTDQDFSRWTDTNIEDLRGIVSDLDTANLTFSGGNGLLEGLGLISAWAITGILLILGVCLGPVNYLYIRRTRSLLLFFITTPILALLGSLAVFGYSAFCEGWSAKFKEAALLIAESGNDAGALYHARGIYSGLSGRTLNFPENALLFPFRKNTTGSQVFDTDLTNGIRLTGGWISPRTPSGILSVTPVTARMGIDIVREGNDYYALNTLSHSIRTLTVALRDSRCATATNLRPGERRILLIERDNKTRDDLRGKVSSLFHNLPFGELRILAECEGLPYMDDNGLNGDKMFGSYFYAASGRMLENLALPEKAGGIERTSGTTAKGERP